MDEDSGDLSDGLDEFEASAEERQAKGKGSAQNYTNKPYDEAYELSQDLSVAESYDGRDAKVSRWDNNSTAVHIDFQWNLFNIYFNSFHY